MAQIPTIEISFDAPPVRVHGESVAVLIRELEETERELFDVRGFYDEEVRLCKTLTDELVNAERENAALNESYWTCARLEHKARVRLRDRIDELEAKAFVEAKRGKWIGVALGTAFLLGTYFGLIMGCAT